MNGVSVEHAVNGGGARVHVQLGASVAKTFITNHSPPISLGCFCFSTVRLFSSTSNLRTFFEQLVPHRVGHREPAPAF